MGDRVDIDINNEGTAFITHIEDRKNYIIRRASNLSKQSHIIAANLDQAMLIVTVNYPITTTVFIDRFLATAEAYRVPVKMIFNKVDRYKGEEKEYLDAMMNLYTTIGYPCSTLCAKTGEGLEELKAELKDKITLLSGHSGVGKSTIINKLVPGVNLRTGDISEYHNKGMHTTTFSEMIPLPEGGYLIDTPGIKGFGTIEMETAEISHYFPEIFKFSLTASSATAHTGMNRAVRCLKRSKKITSASRATRVTSVSSKTRKKVNTAKSIDYTAGRLIPVILRYRSSAYTSVIPDI